MMTVCLNRGYLAAANAPVSAQVRWLQVRLEGLEPPAGCLEESQGARPA
jgi:hypothetical protein